MPPSGDAMEHEEQTNQSRRHRRMIELPNLPKGFTAGTESIGRRRPEGARDSQPKAAVSVVHVDAESAHVPPEGAVLPPAVKQYNPRFQFSVQRTLYAREYALRNGYIQTNGGTRHSTPPMVVGSGSRPEPGLTATAICMRSRPLRHACHRAYHELADE